MQQAIMLIQLLIQGYILLIFIWVLGSWIEKLRYQSWYRMVDRLVRPYMDLFKSLPLRAGMLDLTPMAAIFVLWIFQELLMAAAGGRLR